MVLKSCRLAIIRGSCAILPMFNNKITMFQKTICAYFDTIDLNSFQSKSNTSSINSKSKIRSSARKGQWERKILFWIYQLAFALPIYFKNFTAHPNLLQSLHETPGFLLLHWSSTFAAIALPLPPLPSTSYCQLAVNQFASLKWWTMYKENS